MRKKIMGILCLLVAMTMFTGCMDIQIRFSLKEDKSGSMNALMAINQGLIDETELSELNTDFFDETKQYDSNIQIENKTLEYDRDEMLFVGEEYTMEFNNALIAFSDLDDTEELQWTYLGDDIFRFEIPLNELNEDIAAEGLGNMSTMFKSMGGQILYSLDTDFEVIEHNADYIEEESNYVWELTDDIFSPSPERQSGFLEMRIELEPSKNPMRREIEKNLDMDRTNRDFHGEVLEALGYLKGTNEGLELDKGLTRTEGAIMYSRLLGLEEEIKSFANENPEYESGFTDVPSWAKDTINYLHYMELVNGISDTLYGAGSQMTEAQYTTLALRALGYSDQDGDFIWNAAQEKAVEIGLYADDLRDYTYAKEAAMLKFTRRLMSYISYNALFFESNETGEILYDSRTESE